MAFQAKAAVAMGCEASASMASVAMACETKVFEVSLPKVDA